MKTKLKLSTRTLAGTFVVCIAMLSPSGFAQGSHGDDHQGPQGRGGDHGRSDQSQGNHGNRGNPSRSHGRSDQGRGGPPVSHQDQGRHLGQIKQQNRGGNPGSFAGRSNGQNWGNSRPTHMSAGNFGRGIPASSWRESHPHWNGGYFYHNGGYYYDRGYSYPAVVVNDWSGIAIGFGGVSLLVGLHNDPTLVFQGSIGEPFPVSRYELDLHSSDPQLRLRATYFSKPYFWRNGVRFDRVSVVIGGQHYYRFRRH